jgi:hypothetical protein
VRNTLNRRTRNPMWQLPAYWSSAGSVSASAEDFVVYRLSAHISVVSAVKLRPFRAFFQTGQPVYSPLRVRVMLGALSEDVGGYGAPGDEDAAHYHYTSSDFDVEQTDELQTLTLPAPVVCFGGVLRLQLCGRAQSQAADNRYYVCLAHVCAMGRPWYGFSPSQDGRSLAFDARSVLAGAAAPFTGSSASEADSDTSDDEDDEPADDLLDLVLGQA